MGDRIYTVIQPGDLNPYQFVVDPSSGQVGLAATSYVAAEPISGDKPVMFAGGLTVVPADPTSPDYIYAGIALNGAQVGQAVYTRLLGLIQNPLWSWGPDVPVFVSSSGLTQVAPTSGWSHIIGRAVDATTLQLLPDSPIRVM